MARALADLLHANVLDGQVVAVAGAGPGGGVAARCAALGAATPVLDAPLLDEAAVTRALLLGLRVNSRGSDVTLPRRP